ncbi:hypothetical protein RHM65_10465 [Pseudomonas sp. CCI4.2]|uniref:hypothetical protein n=2 Tax=Pseudomonas TaxID=286 RepID=UPI002AC9DFEE|nr:hypothetical protein [Pseudomonas sp. CCI4.2]WPX55932.1 hypothetical protein RHM65_10465 [Pseudomonas sp. CCI4.2]
MLYDPLTQTTASSRKSRGSRLACEEAIITPPISAEKPGLPAMTLSLASQLPQRFGSGQEQRVVAFANEFALTEIAINLYDPLTQTTASSLKSRGSRLACEEAHHHAADFSRKTWFACNDAFVGKPTPTEIRVWSGTARRGLRE